MQKTETTETAKGNTKTFACHQNKRWCFTFHDYTEDDIETLSQCFKSFKIKYIIGREICPTSKRIHLQGYIECPKKMRWTEFKLNKKIHWEKCKGNQEQNIKYCSKENNYIVDGFDIEEPLDLITDNMLFDWQKEIIDIIKKKADKRTIHWYWEKKGGIGKTSFSKYLSHHYGAIPLEGKKNDILFCAAEFKSNIYIYDLERSMEDYVSYGSIEKIKNGYFMCSKYESKPIVRNSPHVFIFANFEPELDALSLDRWHIVNLDKKVQKDILSDKKKITLSFD